MKSVFDRVVGFFRPSRPAVPANDADYDPIEALREYVRRDVAAGFYDRSQILQQAEDSFEGEIELTILRVEAKSALEEALTAHAAEQLNWPDVTDCDLLDAAFADLEADGVVARQNFSCCGSCGSVEIWDEAAALEAEGKSVRGYAFYHMQDTESAAEGGGLYLNYGAAEDGEEAALEIGHSIVRQLERHGLQVDWNGKLNRRIGVTLDWKRRNQLS